MSVAIWSCPAFYDQMIERKLLGDKTRPASTKKSAAPRAKSGWRWTGRPWNTIPPQRPKFPSLEMAKNGRFASASACAC